VADRSIACLIDQYLDEEYDITTTKLGALYSAWSLPNLVTPFIAGVAIDRFGGPAVIVIGELLMVSGATLFAEGSSFMVFYISRMLLGIGYESTHLAARKLVVSINGSIPQWLDA